MSTSDLMRFVLLAFLSVVSVASSAMETPGIIAELVKKCDLIDDEYMAKKSGTEARLSILRSARGQIGIIAYESEFERQAKKGGGPGGVFGSAYTGAQGPVMFPPGGTYTVVKPDDFDETVKSWKAGLKAKDPVATGELAAALFTEAVKRDGTLNESKMYGLFKTAGEAGNADAMFMQGVCLYYGIGCTKSRMGAFKRLEAWKKASGTTKAKRGGWVARRFEVINKL